MASIIPSDSWRTFVKRRLRLSALLLTCAVVITQSVWALPDDVKQIANISSRQHVYDMNTKTTTFIGDVVFLQGSLKINADKLVYYGKESAKPGMSDHIIATGKPARFRQIPKVGSAPVTAIANRLEYAIQAETLFLVDNASLDQDGSSMTGNRIEYDVKQAMVKASGKKPSTSPANGRVRVIIPPKALDSKNDNQNKDN